MRVLLVWMLVIPIASLAQSVVPANVRASFTLEDIPSKAGLDQNFSFIYGIPLTPGETIGDSYWSSEWSSTNIVLFKGEKVINGILTRYDILNNGLEVKVDDDVRFLPAALIKAYVIRDNDIARTFVNGSSIDPAYPFLLEVLADGKMALLKRTRIQIKNADYNEALDLGSRNNRLLKESILYYAMGNEITELPKSKSRLRSQMEKLGIISGNHRNAKLNDEMVLISLFGDFNSK
jgi:hypothetical protein